MDLWDQTSGWLAPWGGNPGVRKDNGIPAADQDIPLEGHFSGREDNQNSKKLCEINR